MFSFVWMDHQGFREKRVKDIKKKKRTQKRKKRGEMGKPYEILN